MLIERCVLRACLLELIIHKTGEPRGTVRPDFIATERNRYLEIQRLYLLIDDDNNKCVLPTFSHSFFYSPRWNYITKRNIRHWRNITGFSCETFILSSIITARQISENFTSGPRKINSLQKILFLSLIDFSIL